MVTVGVLKNRTAVGRKIDHKIFSVEIIAVIKKIIVSFTIVSSHNSWKKRVWSFKIFLN